MDEKSLFTEFWTKESKTTSKVLARIPESSDYRPDPNSRTAREIAWQIVNEEKMIIEALETGAAEWAPAPAPETMKELSETYDRQSAEIVRRLQALPPDAGKAHSPSSVANGRHHRWPGAFSSTSSTTVGRSRRICARWDRPCRRYTVRASTSHRIPANVCSSVVGLVRVPPFPRPFFGPWLDPADLREPARQLPCGLRAILGILREAIQNDAVECGRNRQLRSFGWRNGTRVCVVHHQSHGRVGREYQLPGQKKVRHTAGGINVGAAIDSRCAEQPARARYTPAYRARRCHVSKSSAPVSDMSGARFAIPKSSTFTKSSSPPYRHTKRFAGLMSRWTRPRNSASASEWHTCRSR